MIVFQPFKNLKFKYNLIIKFYGLFVGSPIFIESSMNSKNYYPYNLIYFYLYFILLISILTWLIPDLISLFVMPMYKGMHQNGWLFWSTPKYYSVLLKSFHLCIKVDVVITYHACGHGKWWRCLLSSSGYIFINLILLFGRTNSLSVQHVVASFIRQNHLISK